MPGELWEGQEHEGNDTRASLCSWHQESQLGMVWIQARQCQRAAADWSECRWWDTGPSSEPNKPNHSNIPVNYARDGLTSRLERGWDTPQLGGAAAGQGMELGCPSELVIPEGHPGRPNLFQDLQRKGLEVFQGDTQALEEI